MFHKILVAIDRSELSRDGFDVALTLSSTNGARLILLHVLTPDDEERPTVPVLFGQDFFPSGASRSVMQIYDDLWQAYVERGMALLQERAAQAATQGIQATCIQMEGNAGSKICNAARTLGADLIVLGRRGNVAGMRELLFGSVSNDVLHHAPCSVLVVQHRPTRTQTPSAMALSSVPMNVEAQ